MKTKRSMKQRTCHECTAEIKKGEQYGQRSVSMGKTCSWTIDDRPTEDIPSWAWSDYRVKRDICSSCAQ